MIVWELLRYVKSRFSEETLEASCFVEARESASIFTEPRVTIIIPTRDGLPLLRACVESVLSKTTYQNFELLIVDNGSRDIATLRYLTNLRKRGVRVFDYPHEFNYSDISNMAAAASDASYLCFLNNDTVVIEPNWLGHLISHAIVPSTGVVGARLFYDNGSVQHAGLAFGYKGIAGHIRTDSSTGMGFDKDICYLVSGVTFACAVVSSQFFSDLGGLDTKFKVGLNDVDFCLRALEMGKRNILCSKAELIHSESQTRPDVFSWRGFVRAAMEVLLFLQKHHRLPQEKYFRVVPALKR